MNSIMTFPPKEPVLKLERPSAERWAAMLAEERRRLQEDQDALREREQNLREYEARLRALQADIDAGRSSGTMPAAGRVSASNPPYHRPYSQSPFIDDAALQLAWEKLHRARELLEAEQTHLRDERITLRERENNVKAREEAVAVREQQIAERELVFATATESKPPMEKDAVSAVSLLTRAPFNIARSVFGGKPAK